MHTLSLHFNKGRPHQLLWTYFQTPPSTGGHLAQY